MAKRAAVEHSFRALPPDCDKVAWLDCDVLFENDDWHEAACAALERHELLQPCEQCMDIDGETHRGNPDASMESILKALATGRLQPNVLKARDKRALRAHYGLAWAARRELVDRHGLYDACILGTGDGAICAAAVGGAS